MSEPTIDAGLLVDLILELRVRDVVCRQVVGGAECTMARGHAGPHAYACDKRQCSVIDGTVGELLASLYDTTGEYCYAKWIGFVCTRSQKVPHRIHVAHGGPAFICVDDGRYAVWRTEDSAELAEKLASPPKPPVSRALAFDLGLRLAADAAYRFFAGLHLQDQPLAVQREARDVLQALGWALKGTGADK